MARQGLRHSWSKLRWAHIAWWTAGRRPRAVSVPSAPLPWPAGKMRSAASWRRRSSAPLPELGTLMSLSVARAVLLSPSSAWEVCSFAPGFPIGVAWPVVQSNNSSGFRAQNLLCCSKPNPVQCREGRQPRQVMDQLGILSSTEAGGGKISLNLEM